MSGCTKFFYFASLQGVTRLGSRGNIEVFRTLSNPKYSITTLSSPIPPPAWGGHPYLKASIYAAILGISAKITVSGELLRGQTNPDCYQFRDVLRAPWGIEDHESSGRRSGFPRLSWTCRKSLRFSDPEDQAWCKKASLPKDTCPKCKSLCGILPETTLIQLP